MHCFKVPTRNRSDSEGMIHPGTSNQMSSNEHSDTAIASSEVQKTAQVEVRSTAVEVGTLLSHSDASN